MSSPYRKYIKTTKQITRQPVLIFVKSHSLVKTATMVKKVEKTTRTNSIRSGSIASTRNGSSLLEKAKVEDSANLAKKSSVRSVSNGKDF